jgi:hypothetical protein
MPDFLIDLIQPERLTTVVDIGAIPIDTPPPYRNLLERGFAASSASSRSPKRSPP